MTTDNKKLTMASLTPAQRKELLGTLTIADMKEHGTSIEEMAEVVKMFTPVTSRESAIEVGNNYFFRTVTMYFVGRVVDVTRNEFVLEEATWIADTGKYGESFHTGQFTHAESYDKDMRIIINRASMIDAVPWTRELPYYDPKD